MVDSIKELEAEEKQAIEDALKAVASHEAPTRTTSHPTWQDDRGMNDRIKKLRHQSETTQPYVDMWLYDIKTLDNEKHKKYIGQPNDQILRNFEFLAANGAPINLRIPVVHPVNDDDESIAAIRDYVKSTAGFTPVNLLPYHTTGSSKYVKLGRPYLAKDLEVPSAERMEHLKDMFLQAGFTDVSIGG